MIHDLGLTLGDFAGIRLACAVYLALVVLGIIGSQTHILYFSAIDNKRHKLKLAATVLFAQ